MFGNDIIELLCSGGIENTLSQCRPKLDINGVLKIRQELEKISSGMEMTVTFKPELRDRYNSGTLTNIVRKLLNKIGNKFKLQCVLVGEFSDMGVYHMHGIIKTSEGRCIDAVRRLFKRDIGRIEIKQISYVDSYIDYIFKEFDLQRKIYEDETICSF